MRMAYLIMAHGDAAQLDMLVERLVPAGSADVAIIHADARSDLWQALRGREDGERVRIVRDPVACLWGHKSQVEAIFKLIDAALACDVDYAHLISGVDWPVAARSGIIADLSGPGPLPCCLEAIPGFVEFRMQTYRFDTRWLRLDLERERLAYALTWQLRRASGWLDALRIRSGRERSRPFGQWHKGSTWWSLPRDVLEAIACELPPLVAAGRLDGTQCADEHLIQSFVATRYRERLRDYRRFIVFPEGSSSPRLLAEADRAGITASGAWFARKVSLGHDPFFLDFPADGPVQSALDSRQTGVS